MGDGRSRHQLEEVRSMTVAVHPVESISNEVSSMQRQIASRAEELHETLGSAQPLDH
jgi:hypothetical protein